MFPAFARTSSTGSIDVVSSASSAQNTDCSLTTDDEDSDHKSTHTYKDRRREAHSKVWIIHINKLINNYNCQWILFNIG